MNNSHLYRGFFDPITLGIYLQFDYTEYKNKDFFIDTEKIDAFSSLVHEFSHYLQFYGTTFGLIHLMNLQKVTEITKKLIKETEKQNKKLSTPLLKYIPNTEHAKKIANIDSEELINVLFASRFFQEEFYGWTYPLFDINPIYNNGYPAISTPVILPIYDSNSFQGYLPVTGKIIFETQACYNETKYVGFAAPNRDDALEYFENNYINLEPNHRNEYLGVSFWLNNLGLQEIEPIIYFIVLNQNMQGCLTKIGEYRLTTTLKKILLKSSSFTNFKKPNNEQELLSVIDNICELSDLDNPFDSIKIMHDLLSEMPEDSYTIENLIYEILDWQLKNKYYAVYWYEKPSLIWKSIPIINVTTTDNLEGNKVSFFPISNKEELEKAIGFSRNLIPELQDTYLVNSLYNNELTRCPYNFISKPAVCKSCKDCSGFIPDENIKNDCPISKQWKNLGFAALPS